MCGVPEVDQKEHIDTCCIIEVNKDKSVRLSPKFIRLALKSKNDQP
jgi:hypothetical protein